MTNIPPTRPLRTDRLTTLIASMAKKKLPPTSRWLMVALDQCGHNAVNVPPATLSMLTGLSRSSLRLNLNILKDNGFLVLNVCDHKKIMATLTYNGDS